MNALEKQFAQTVAEHKSTIYTVCYMFSQDADEVNDLFQEVLVNLWKGIVCLGWSIKAGIDNFANIYGGSLRFYGTFIFSYSASLELQEASV